MDEHHKQEHSGGHAERTAFHLRKAGLDLGPIDDEELKQVPLVPAGAPLEQGATYVNLKAQHPEEFTARGDMCAQPEDAYAPKDRVPYQIWNRLIGEEKPGEQNIKRPRA
jgi:hypothetical protein